QDGTLMADHKEVQKILFLAAELALLAIPFA
ncbi:hypothetical protein C5167_040350, partial [Papaver somniferum]